MKASTSSFICNIRQRCLWSLGVGSLLVARSFWPPRDPLTDGWLALRDLLLTFIFLGLVLLLAHCLGNRILNFILPKGILTLERFIFSLALGIGTLGYINLTLGILGILRHTWIAGILLLLTIWLAPDLSQSIKHLIRFPRRLASWWSQASTVPRAVVIITGMIGLVSLFNSLGPPWDYDGLMYHLLGPKLFLEQGRIFPYPDNWYINAPFTVEMVFSLGMAFGDDVFPKLIHFSLGVIYVIATYALASRWLQQDRAWLAVAVVLGIPTLPIWAGFAYIDLGWSLFEVLATYAIVIWWRKGGHHWLILSGLMVGLAMGSKYLGLMGFGLLGLFLIAATYKQGFQTITRSALMYALPALLVASPWYVKNTFWFGNPIFPLLSGGPGWDPQRLSTYNAYLDIFGVGKRPLDYLLLPWNIYVQHARFGAVMNRIDIPSVLFPLTLLYPLRRGNPVVRSLLLLSLGRFVLWSVGSQQVRFLLPVYPLLAVATAYMLPKLIRKRPGGSALYVFFPTLAVGLMALTLFYQIQVALKHNPSYVITGLESRHQYLMRNERDYPAMQYLKEFDAQGERALLIGNGRGYYCVPRCVPDPDHFRWASELAELKDQTDFQAWMESQGIGYITLSLEDLDFLLQHDPTRVITRTLENIASLRDQGALVEVYKDEWTILYHAAR